MNTPCVELDVETVLLQLISFPLIHRPTELIGHAPRSPGKSRCRNPDPSLRRLFGQVDDDEAVRVFMGPGPGYEVEVALIIRPSSPLAELPLPSSELVAAKGS